MIYVFLGHKTSDSIRVRSNAQLRFLHQFENLLRLLLFPNV